MSDLRFYKMNDKSNDYCEIYYDNMLEQYVIEFYHNNGHMFYEETYARSLKYVEQQADKWINGERQIEQ